MRQPKKIMMAGDWHGNTAWAIKAVYEAVNNGCDVIVQLGDFGIWPGPGGKRYLDDLNAVLESLDVMLYFVDGNHEDFTQFTDNKIVEDGTRKFRSNIYHLPRAFTWEWFGRKWMSLGGAFSVDKDFRVLNQSWWEEEQTTDEDVERAIAAGHVDVLLTHDAPLDIVEIPGINDANFPFHPKMLPLAKENQARIKEVILALEPEEVWHGHFHVAYGRELVHAPGKEWTIIGLACDGMDYNTYIYGGLE